MDKSYIYDYTFVQTGSPTAGFHSRTQVQV